MTKIATLAATLLLSLPMFSRSAAAQEPPRYHLLNTIALGGEGGWDYLSYDALTDRLFISRSTHVWVVDVDSGNVVGDIPGTEGVHGIALAPSLKKGFTSNGASSTVTVFDLSTLKVLDRIKTGEGPDAILYDPASNRVFTFNGRGHSATVIDGPSGKVLGTIALDGKPEFAATDGRGTVFVNIEDKSEMSAIDSNTLKIKAAWPLAPCDSPSGLSIDADYHRLFAGCRNKLMTVVDSDTGTIVGSLPIGEGVDATAADPQRHLAFSSNGDGTLTFIEEQSAYALRVADNVTTQKGARTMAYDPVHRRVFLVTADFGPAVKDAKGHARPPVLPGTFRLLIFGL